MIVDVPVLWTGADLTAAESYIQNVVTKVADPKVKAVSLAFQNDGWGCDWHPSLKTHDSMATALTQELKTTLGW